MNINMEITESQALTIAHRIQGVGISVGICIANKGCVETNTNDLAQIIKLAFNNKNNSDASLEIEKYLIKYIK